MRLEFWVPGAPVAKGRGRMFVGPNGRPRQHTPKATVDWERQAALFATQALPAGHERFQGAVSVHVEAWFPIPTTWPRWKREMAKAGQLGHTQRPDGDNIAKAVMDAINATEVVWHDDAQVVYAAVHKRYGERVGVGVRVESCPLVPSQQRRRPGASGAG